MVIPTLILDGGIQCRMPDNAVTGHVVDISDGYNTFGDLYEHRITLWIALCKLVSQHRAYEDLFPWRSRLHSDGSSYDGWFVLGMGYFSGMQMTYHVPAERWDDARFARTLTQAPEYDGHSAAVVLQRIKQLL